MFGVVPKALWERCCPADEQNRIPLSLTCLLIRAHGKNILVDTGLGDKEDAKFLPEIRRRSHADLARIPTAIQPPA